MESWREAGPPLVWSSAARAARLSIHQLRLGDLAAFCPLSTVTCPLPASEGPGRAYSVGDTPATPEDLPVASQQCSVFT